MPGAANREGNRLSRWKQQRLEILRAIQYVDDVDLLSADAIEDQVVGVDAAANAVVFVAGDQGIALRKFGKCFAMIQELVNESCGAVGVVRSDVVGNRDQVVYRRVGDENLHGGVGDFFPRRIRGSFRTVSMG